MEVLALDEPRHELLAGVLEILELVDRGEPRRGVRRAILGARGRLELLGLDVPAGHTDLDELNAGSRRRFGGWAHGHGRGIAQRVARSLRAMPKPVQLELAAPCPGCGSRQHQRCGYDPETVRPTLTVAEALGATLTMIYERHGVAGLRRAGVGYWGAEDPTGEARELEET
jgi:hypothetical protein